MSFARWRQSGALVLCGGLCVLFAGLSWSAVRGKSATWDEPGHAATGWMMRWRQDYRFAPDVPPLWEYWITLANGRGALHAETGSQLYREPKTKDDLFLYIAKLLYQTPGNDGLAVVGRARAMALVLGVGLAILLGRWAWELGGAAAAVAAMFLYCLDPNLLGHGPLVKNDVGFTLVYFAACYAMWRLGRRFTIGAAAAVVLLTAAAVAVKLSGVLLGPVLVVALSARAIAPRPWEIFGREVTGRRGKLLAAGAVWLGAAIVTYAGLWACYGFRFEAGPDGLQSDIDQTVEVLHQAQVSARRGHIATAAEADAEPRRISLSTRVVVYLGHHRLLPQAWADGFVLTQAGDQNRDAFLWEHHYIGGRWYYFPAAAMFKLPLGTLGACLAALILGLRRVQGGLLKADSARWAAMAIGVPAGVYGVAIVTANMNVGFRHAFAVLPFVYLAVSLAARHAWQAGAAKAGQASAGQIAVIVLGAAVAAESAAAYPNYLAFFNVASASHRLSLLGDSNLDWGQDLPLLAKWQKEHPDDTLYLSYFGFCDPAAYGIRYVNLPPGFRYGPMPQLPTGAGYVAISATNLQQVYGEDPIAEFFAGREPRAVLGQTIYIYRLEPKDIGPPDKD